VNSQALFDDISVSLDLSSNTTTDITATCLDCSFSISTSFVTLNVEEFLGWNIEVESSIQPAAGASGDSFTLDLKLSKEPTDDVTINSSTSDSNLLNITPSSITFTTANYNTV